MNDLPGSQAGLSIGEVVDLLQPEFNDLTDSKIRFLEDRRLIAPSRTEGGYRSFGAHDIEVLRWILTRQRDQYLPLSVISERIERGEHLADIWAGDGASDEVTYGIAELCAECGLSVEAVGELIEFGLLVPLSDARSGAAAGPPTAPAQATLGLEPAPQRFSSEALTVARIAREFATYGLGPRHLRLIRNAATRDGQMFAQGIQPIRLAGGENAQAGAQRAFERLIRLCERFRALVIEESVRQGAAGG